MPQSINLIPQQEVQEQTQTQYVRLSTILTIVVLVVTASATGYLFYTTKTLKEKVVGFEAEIGSLRGEIGKLASVEISARNLDKKFGVLKEIFAKREYYSLLLDEVKARKPESVVIDSMTLREDNTLMITGLGSTYTAVAEFLNTMINNNFSNGNPKLKGLFTSVSLNTVNLENKNNEVKFSVVVQFDTGQIRQ